MGNARSGPKSYLGAMSSVTTGLEREDVRRLRHGCGEQCGRDALLREDGGEREVLEKLFVLFDKTGEGCVSGVEFCVGLTALTSGSACEKLELALETFDKAKKEFAAPEALFVCAAVNKLADWFGDDALSVDELHALVGDVFRASPLLPRADLVRAVLNHALVRARLAPLLELDDDDVAQETGHGQQGAAAALPTTTTSSSSSPADDEEEEEPPPATTRSGGDDGAATTSSKEEATKKPSSEAETTTTTTAPQQQEQQERGEDNNNKKTTTTRLLPPLTN